MNRAEMVKPGVIEATLPIATDQEVQNIFRSKIESIHTEAGLRKTIKQSCTLLEPLFSFTAEEYSFLELKDGSKVRRVESNRLQELGFKFMGQYGFDENNSKPFSGIEKGKQKDVELADGTSSEFKLYPSKTNKDLAFERKSICDTATGKTISTRWTIRVDVGK